MNLTNYKNCKTSLNFKPLKPWCTDWPAFAWEQILISGFTQQSKYVLNFTKQDISFLSLFYTCYNKLSLLELGDIFVKWNPKKEPHFVWKDFFTLYGFGQNTDFFIQQLKIFISLPNEFKNWIHQKNVHLGELRAITSLKNVSQLDFIFRWITTQNLSHSLGVKAVELSVELHLMGVCLHEVITLNTPAQQGIQMMEQKRHPISAAQDKIKQEQLNQIIWPTNVNAQWQRRGDNTGIEIKLWCKTQTELDEQIKRIQNTKLFNL